MTNFGVTLAGVKLVNQEQAGEYCYINRDQMPLKVIKKIAKASMY